MKWRCKIFYTNNTTNDVKTAIQNDLNVIDAYNEGQKRAASKDFYLHFECNKNTTIHQTSWPIQYAYKEVSDVYLKSWEKLFSTMESVKK